MNNKNPWGDASPFAPMFSDAIKYQNNTVSTQIIACVFPIEDIDPIADFDAGNEVRKCVVNVECSKFKGVKPCIGDKITLEDGTVFGIAKVDVANGIYSLTAKETGNDY